MPTTLPVEGLWGAHHVRANDDRLFAASWAYDGRDRGGRVGRILEGTRGSFEKTPADVCLLNRGVGSLWWDDRSIIAQSRWSAGGPTPIVPNSSTSRAGSRPRRRVGAVAGSGRVGSRAVSMAHARGMPPGRRTTLGIRFTSRCALAATYRAFGHSSSS